MHDVARGIRTARHNAGLTQEALAEAASVSARALRSWEHNKHDLALTSAVMLADALEISLDTLIMRRKE